MLDGATFLPAEVMISSFLRSTTAKKPSSSRVPMSPVWSQPSSSISARVASVLQVVAGVFTGPRTRISPSSPRVTSMPGLARPTVPSSNPPGPLAVTRAAGLRHPVDVVDLEAETGHEPRDVRAASARPRTRPRRPGRGRAAAGASPRMALVGLLVGGLDLRRHHAADLLRLDPRRAPAAIELLDLVRLAGSGSAASLAGEAGLDLLPHPRDAEERRRVHLAECGRAAATGRRSRACGCPGSAGVETEHPLGERASGREPTAAWASVRPARPPGCRSPRRARCGG